MPCAPIPPPRARSGPCVSRAAQHARLQFAPPPPCCSHKVRWGGVTQAESQKTTPICFSWRDAVAFRRMQLRCQVQLLRAFVQPVPETGSLRRLSRPLWGLSSGGQRALVCVCVLKELGHLQISLHVALVACAANISHSPSGFCLTAYRIFPNQ